jgi:hypothetical protein
LSPENRLRGPTTCRAKRSLSPFPNCPRFGTRRGPFCQIRSRLAKMERGTSPTKTSASGKKSERFAKLTECRTLSFFGKASLSVTKTATGSPSWRCLFSVCSSVPSVSSCSILSSSHFQSRRCVIASLHPPLPGRIAPGCTTLHALQWNEMQRGTTLQRPGTFNVGQSPPPPGGKRARLRCPRLASDSSTAQGPRQRQGMPRQQTVGGRTRNSDALISRRRQMGAAHVQ